MADMAAIGDGANDLQMIIDAGCGVATANASSTLKQAADVVLEHTNDQDAVAHFVESTLSNAPRRRGRKPDARL